jgi:hypothetical protein
LVGGEVRDTSISGGEKEYLIVRRSPRQCPLVLLVRIKWNKSEGVSVMIGIKDGILKFCISES